VCYIKTIVNIIPYIIFYNIKMIRQFGCFTEKGDNPVENPKIYNVEGNNRLLYGPQPLTM